MCGEKVLAGSLEALKEFVLNTDYSHCIGMIVPRRLGVLIFMAKLEGKHYSPGSSNSGNIIVSRSEVTSSTNIISGTFSCKVYNIENSSDIINVTDGRFDINYTTLNH